MDRATKIENNRGRVLRGTVGPKVRIKFGLEIIPC
jgi:hypothetical protein